VVGSRVTSEEGRGDSVPTYDRALLLNERKRNDVLSLWEIQRYGRDSYGDPDYVRIYGLAPADWYARGVRLLARTAVECTRDPLADLMGRDIAAVARTAPGVSGSTVVDPFAGSGNTLYWIVRHVGAFRAIGFELDSAVFEASRRNLSIVGLDIELIQVDYEDGLRSLSIPLDRLAIVFVAPPWGDALSGTSGLDLRRTTPPVTEIVDVVTGSLDGHRILFATQVFESIDATSVEDVTARFDWSELKIYDINVPGANHGVLLGTKGWTP
jgi:16S rRNA G966 N2-methylase RsmD